MATASINWGAATKYDENFEELASLLDNAPPYQPPNYNDTSPIIPTSHVRSPTDEKTLETLSPEQRYALRLIQGGKNVWIVGGAGTGKSHVFQLATKCFFQKDIAIAATTGCAAMLVGGTTLHSLFGIVNEDADADDMVKQLRKRKESVLLLTTIHVLFVDEVSMLSGQLAEKLEYVLRKIRNDPRPFGGVQMVVCGDPAQLPPVTLRGMPRKKYVFECVKWYDWFPQSHHVWLTHVFRQDEVEFREILSDVRDGKYTNRVKEFMEKVKKELDVSDGIQPTYLTARRNEVDEINRKKLADLPGPMYCIDAEDNIHPDKLKKFNESCQAPEKLMIKVGAQVMLVKNIDPKGGLSNGSRGVVVNIVTVGHAKEVVSIHVKFMNGRIFDCTPAEFEQRTPNGFVLAKRSQFPLILAFAWSIHKSQGQTLDKVSIDLGSCFGDAMAYVALSRARNIKGLQVINFNPSCVKQSPIVKEFYERLRKAASEQTDEPPTKKRRT